MKYLGPPQSGSNAATTASRNRYGQYYRNRSIPVNPQTVAQGTNRNLFGSVASAWRSLGLSEREQWSAYAATMPKMDPLGSTIYWSGFQTFVECGMLRASVGLALPTLPPADVSFPALELSVILDASAFTAIATFTPDPVPAGMNLIIDATTRYSAGVMFAGPSEYRRLGFEPATTASPSDMSAEYAAVWGGVGPAGLRTFWRARLLSDTGCAGPWVYSRSITVA